MGRQRATALLPNLQSLPMRPMANVLARFDRARLHLGVALLSGILFGLAPAFTASRSNLAEPLKENGRISASGAKSRLRYSLVAAEVALTLGRTRRRGMMIASVARLLGVDPGLDPKNVLAMGMSQAQQDLYYGPPAHAGFCPALTTQVGSLPGVISVSAIGHLPLGGGSAGRGIGIEGRPDPGPEKQQGARYSVVCSRHPQDAWDPTPFRPRVQRQGRRGHAGRGADQRRDGNTGLAGRGSRRKRFKIGPVGTNPPG